MRGFGSPLHRASLLLLKRLGDLERQISEGDETAWPEYRETALVVASLQEQAEPEMLTTKDMATRLGVSVKTLLRHKQKGHITPTVKQGKLLRWSGTERVGE